MSTEATQDFSSDEVRCASRSRLAGLDPIGSAGSHSGYLLADVALPWPSDVGRLEGVAATLALLAGTAIRFQATVPVGDPRVVLYGPAGPIRAWRSGSGGGPASPPSLVRRELALDGATPGSLAAVTARLLAGDGGGAPGPQREIIVCTHGRRDVCCGARGSRLHLELVADPGILARAAAQPGNEGPAGAGVDVRRTSHTGGHRFAPTAVVFPEATAWAYLDVDVLRAVVSRSGPLSEVLGHYRGWSGLASPSLQALERAVLAEVGWELFDCPRWGEDLGAGTVRLHVKGPGSSSATWQARVVPGRRVPRPECGQPVAEVTKSEAELVLSDLAVTDVQRTGSGAD